MISVIVPVLNEEQALPTTLKRVQEQLESDQIIVVDGGSIDNTCQIVREQNNVLLINSARGRAVQMNTGAEHADGDWLLFLHADTLLPEDALKTIKALNYNSRIRAGCFHQRFSKDHWFLRFVSWLHNWRCNRGRIIYGDQAMFIRRELFEQIGGFPENEILEDVLISELIVQQTTPIFLEDEVITSSRKFEQNGIYKSFFDIFVIMSCYELRLPILRKGFFTAFR
ncbi:MAG: TIGR04283 family arsenosugar biosynthesis glycosyltransferase [Proteobacteria bacterium]|nr:TIGR04283 family arsenosugar biosynthesis glycosyltransferase [Pseudomonadota bacterium]